MIQETTKLGNKYCENAGVRVDPGFPISSLASASASVLAPDSVSVFVPKPEQTLACRESSPPWPTTADGTGLDCHSYSFSSSSASCAVVPASGGMHRSGPPMSTFAMHTATVTLASETHHATITSTSTTAISTATATGGGAGAFRNPLSRRIRAVLAVLALTV